MLMLCPFQNEQSEDNLLCPTLRADFPTRIPPLVETVAITWMSFLSQFPEETESDLLSVTIDGTSHYSSTSEGSCSVFSSPKTPAVFSPSISFQPEEGRRDDSLSSTSEDSEKDEDHEKEKPYFYQKTQWAFLIEREYLLQLQHVLSFS